MSRFLLFSSLVLTASLASACQDLKSPQQQRSDAQDCLGEVQAYHPDWANEMYDCYVDNYYHPVASDKDNYTVVMEELNRCFSQARSKSSWLITAEELSAQNRCILEADEKLGLGARADEEQGERDADPSAREAEDGEKVYAGEPRINLDSLKPVRVACAPKDEFHDYYLCDYEFEWEVSYALPDPGGFIECRMQAADLYGTEYWDGAQFEPGTGVWSFVAAWGGFYPGLVEVRQEVTCEVRIPDRRGTSADRVSEDLIMHLALGEF